MASRGTLTEAEIKRNPHGDFKAVEAARPPFDASSAFRLTRTPAPDWTFGQGPNAVYSAPPPSSSASHVSIDPYEEGRAPAQNYKLLISAVVPRPVAFVSTRSADGASENLAPFSYFQVINHDPPLFIIGFASPANPPERAKDTLRNLLETRECVVNIISEGFVEAANAASVDAPFGASEWAVSGLTPVRDCADVRCARVGEAVFSVEARLESVREFKGRSAATRDRTTGSLVVVEGTRFWVRGDALDEGRSLVDPAVLRPISRLGGITYGRVTEALEIPRPNFERDLGGQAGYEKLLEKQKEKEKGNGEGQVPN